MVEVLAAGLTGGRVSVDVPPLKTRDGEPHDLGQFFLVIDPTAFDGDGFAATVAGLVAAVAGDGAARLPGSAPSTVDSVEIPDEEWAAAQALVG